MALSTTYTLGDSAVLDSGQGIMQPWVPFITQPGGGTTEPTNVTKNGSKFTVVDGVFYGHLSILFNSTSDFGVNSSHLELWLPHRRINNKGRVIGSGIVWKTSELKNHTNIQVTGFHDYDNIAALMPLMPYYDGSRFDYASDPDYLYEDIMNGTQARVEATRTAWQNIATNWSAHAQQPLNISAYIRYHIKQ